MKNRQSAPGFLLFCIFALSPTIVRAQEEPQPQQQEAPPIDQSEPKPAAQAPFPVIDPNTQDYEDQGDLRADFTPLTGVQNPTLGSPELRHSYWAAGLQYGSTIQSVPANGSDSSSWYAQNFFLGNLSLVKAWGRSNLSLNYTGGGSVSSSTQQYTGVQEGFQNFQQLAAAQNFHTTRWAFQILDQFSYLPQGSFGFGAGTNLGTAGIGGSLGATVPALSNSVVPNQSIFFTGPVYSNLGTLQATYTLSQRSSVTVSGSYGILRYSDPGDIDSDTTYASIGYNYVLSRKDDIGVAYSFSSYHYDGLDQAYGNQTVALAYSRKITGRLALQLNGGPQITTYRVPVGTATQQTGFLVNAYLRYGARNGSLTANYVHGLSGGSGIYVGSNLDQINLSASRRLGRVWNGHVNFGYAHNSALNGSGQASYDNWFGSGGVSRPLGPYVYLGISYAGYISKYGTPATTNTTNSINISLQWHMRPMTLD